MRSIVPLILVTFVCATCADAQQPATPVPGEVTVTLDARDQDIKDVLKAVFAKTNGSYAIDPKVQGKVNLGLKNVPLTIALQEATRQVDATYRLRNGIYEIMPKVQNLKVTAGGDAGVRLVDLDVTDALKSLPGTSVVEIAPGVTGQVAVVGNYDERKTVAEIARQVDARVVETANGYRLEPMNSLRKPVSAVRYKDEDLRKVVVDLLNQAEVDYVVSGGIAGRVTVNMGQTDVQSALEAILAPIGARVTLRRGVFIVSAR